MIGLDTNILLRLVVEDDDPAQTRQAKRFVQEQCTAETPGYINSIVLAELVWVLVRSYGYTRADIVKIVENLLAGADRFIEHPDAVTAALEDYRKGRADFVDALINHVNRVRGCRGTATFDRKAARVPGFVKIG